MKVPVEWNCTPLVHDGKKKIAIRFEKRQEWIALVKQIPGSFWNQNSRCWLVADNEHTRHLLRMEKKDSMRCMLEDNIRLPKETVSALTMLIDHMRSRRYSDSTIRSYIQTLIVFFSYFSDRNIKEITNEDVIRFNREYVLRKRLSASYQSQFVNALKLFYGEVMVTAFDPGKLGRPHKPFQLPGVLSEREVDRSTLCFLAVAVCKCTKAIVRRSDGYSI